MASKENRSDDIQGEGDYKSARRYDRETQAFVEAGKVEPAAQAAEPTSAAERDEMLEAEKRGLARSKGEDRLLRKGAQIKQ